MSMTDRIKAKITAAFDPEHLEVINESHLHRGHAGDDGSGETHFKLIIVSKAFQNQSRLERQRAVYAVLSEELSSKIHALSIDVRPD